MIKNYLLQNNIYSTYENSILKMNQRKLIDISSEKTGKIVGFFDCSYNKELSHEYAEVNYMEPDTSLIEFKITNINSVTLRLGTEGISSEKVVAIFPENFKWHNPTPSDPIFYFADKFAKRHLKYTRKVIPKLKFSSMFDELARLSQKEVEQLATNWFYLHEHFHRLGDMPITNCLFEKSSKYSSAIEELRVDLLSIEYLLNKETKTKNEHLTALFIISERMIGYPFFRKIDSFDSYSSLIFFQEVINSSLNNSELSSLSISRVINCLIKKIEEIEARAMLCSSKEERKESLITSGKELVFSSINSKCFFENMKVGYGI